VYPSPGVYHASVTETSSTGTSTRVVSTGQSVLRNGGKQAHAVAEVDIRTHVGLKAATVRKSTSVKAGAMTFSATATNQTTGAPVVGITLGFTLKTQTGHTITCSGVTSSNGTATCKTKDGNILFLRTPWTYSVNFAGNALYYNANATGTIIY
jgi:hypothetical protein